MITWPCHRDPYRLGAIPVSASCILPAITISRGLPLPPSPPPRAAAAALPKMPPALIRIARAMFVRREQAACESPPLFGRAFARAASSSGSVVSRSQRTGIHEEDLRKEERRSRARSGARAGEDKRIESRPWDNF